MVLSGCQNQEMMVIFSSIQPKSMHFYLQILNFYLISKTMALFETLNIYQSSSSIGPSSPRGSASPTSIFPNMNELVAVWKKLVKNGSVLEVNFSQTILFDKHFFKTKSVTKSRVHCIYILSNFYYNHFPRRLPKLLTFTVSAIKIKSTKTLVKASKSHKAY